MSYLYFPDEKQPQNVIVLSNSVYQSYLGRYFLGQTKTIYFEDNSMAWGGLINPDNSNVNMFLNAYTISNYSDQPITAEGWLSSSLPGAAITSHDYAAGNQSIAPPTQPMVKIQSANYVTTTPSDGTYAFTRRVEPMITLTKHDFQGMYMIPPGGSFVLFFLPGNKKPIHVRIAFGWWEEEID